ncbi:unnamed protein product [Candida verbasci]|uniref:Uncharacterized protein n=1 Tax=Candida verbasci TaxID=1227364 RepID=A0A9W4TWJ1_9ASCO|nr:unnamed protein product [Candida verbasci]
MQFKVSDLKDICRSIGLSLVGVKKTLQEKIITYFDLGRTHNDHIRLSSIRMLVLMKKSNRQLPPYNQVYDGIKLGKIDFLDFLKPKESSSSTESKPYHNHSLFFVLSPFYNLTRNLHCSPQNAPATRGKATYIYNFILTAEEYNYFKLDSKKYRLYFMMGSKYTPKSSSDVLVEYPEVIDFEINKSRIPSKNFTGLKGKAGTSQPIDITNFLNRPPSLNSITLRYQQTTKDFMAYIYIIELVPIENILLDIKKRSIKMSETLKIIKQADNENELTMTAETVTLNDPITRVRMNTPVQSIYCRHYQCFDAYFFLLAQKQLPSMSCPVCNMTIRMDHLAISEYVMDILNRTTEEDEEIRINPDGTWQVLQNDNDDDQPNQSKTDENPFSKEQSIEIVTLSDEEDEEAEDLMDVVSPRPPTVSPQEPISRKVSNGDQNILNSNESRRRSQPSRPNSVTNINSPSELQGSRISSNDSQRSRSTSSNNINSLIDIQRSRSNSDTTNKTSHVIPESRLNYQDLRRQSIENRSNSQSSTLQSQLMSSISIPNNQNQNTITSTTPSPNLSNRSPPQSQNNITTIHLPNGNTTFVQQPISRSTAPQVQKNNSNPITPTIQQYSQQSRPQQTQPQFNQAYFQQRQRPLNEPVSVTDQNVNSDTRTEYVQQTVNSPPPINSISPTTQQNTNKKPTEQSRQRDLLQRYSSLFVHPRKRPVQRPINKQPLQQTQESSSSSQSNNIQQVSSHSNDIQNQQQSNNDQRSTVSQQIQNQSPLINSQHNSPQFDEPGLNFLHQRPQTLNQQQSSSSNVNRASIPNHNQNQNVQNVPIQQQGVPNQAQNLMQQSTSQINQNQSSNMVYSPVGHTIMQRQSSQNQMSPQQKHHQIQLPQQDSPTSNQVDYAQMEIYQMKQQEMYKEQIRQQQLQKQIQQQHKQEVQQVNNQFNQQSQVPTPPSIQPTQRSTSGSIQHLPTSQPNQQQIQQQFQQAKQNHLNSSQSQQSTVVSQNRQVVIAPKPTSNPNSQSSSPNSEAFNLLLTRSNELQISNSPQPQSQRDSNPFWKRRNSYSSYPVEIRSRLVEAELLMSEEVDFLHVKYCKAKNTQFIIRKKLQEMFADIEQMMSLPNFDSKDQEYVKLKEEVLFFKGCLNRVQLEEADNLDKMKLRISIFENEKRTIISLRQRSPVVSRFDNGNGSNENTNVDDQNMITNANQSSNSPNELSRNSNENVANLNRSNYNEPRNKESTDVSQSQTKSKKQAAGNSIANVFGGTWTNSLESNDKQIEEAIVSRKLSDVANTKLFENQLVIHKNNQPQLQTLTKSSSNPLQTPISPTNPSKHVASNANSISSPDRSKRQKITGLLGIELQDTFFNRPDDLSPIGRKVDSMSLHEDWVHEVSKYNSSGIGTSKDPITLDDGDDDD